MKKQSLFRFVLLPLLLVFATLACSAGPLNALFATPTPTFTNTPTVTPSPTPTNTPLPTATPTLTPTPLPTGTAKEEQEDGSVRFIDYDNNYEIIFPSGWTAASLNAEDINKLASIGAKNNPELEKSLNAIKNMDSDVFRSFAFDFRPDHMINGFTSNISVSVQNNGIMKALPVSTILESIVQSIPQMYKGIKIVSTEAITTDTGITIANIETNWSVTTVTGKRIPVYQKLIIFKTPEGAAIITMSTPLSLQKTIASEFEQIVNSIKKLSN